MHSLPQRNFCPKQKCSRIYNKTKLPQRERECMKELQNETGFSCKSCTQASPHTAWIKSVWTCSFCLFPERPTDNILKTRLSVAQQTHTFRSHSTSTSQTELVCRQSWGSCGQAAWPGGSAASWPSVFLSRSVHACLKQPWNNITTLLSSICRY